jgi:hypothetical protein
MFAFSACVTYKKTVIKQKGFRYTVPADMQESPDDAYRYRYDNLIVDKGMNCLSSNRLIAIRHAVNREYFSLMNFVDRDQGLLRQSIKIDYDKVRWVPSGFQKKNIDHFSFQFKYQYGEEMIYQRSVYLQCEDKFYVISLSSKEKFYILEPANDLFWESICID